MKIQNTAVLLGMAALLGGCGTPADAFVGAWKLTRSTEVRVQGPSGLEPRTCTLEWPLEFKRGATGTDVGLLWFGCTLDGTVTADSVALNTRVCQFEKGAELFLRSPDCPNVFPNVAKDRTEVVFDPAARFDVKGNLLTFVGSVQATCTCGDTLTFGPVGTMSGTRTGG
jgi:hypothetical protein